MKTLSIFLALVNALLAGLILAYSLSPTEIVQAEPWWSFVKMTAAASVILVGGITWLGTLRPLSPNLLALCSQFLVALGAATVVWTFHLALVSGDAEYFMVLYGGSLAAQGMASLFGFGSHSRSTASD